MDTKSKQRKPSNTPSIKGLSQENIRWMIRRDMPEVLAIENDSFQFRWSEDDFIRALRQRNCIGMVASWMDEIVAYMVYELHKNHLHLLNLAVAGEYRRQGVGQKMIEKLIGKLSAHRRLYISCEVRETNLDAQIFFRDMGFKAIQVRRDWYDDTDEDAYFFRYRLSRREQEDV